MIAGIYWVVVKFKWNNIKHRTVCDTSVSVSITAYT